MCNQAVSLISAELEHRGIATVCIILLREVAERIHPPRALCVPYPHGYPLGTPHDAEIQKRVMRAAFELLALNGPGPLLRDYSD
jgi:D-proline reductase (dithiol) PrdB